jgi:hypothetical protein
VKASNSANELSEIEYAILTELDPGYSFTPGSPLEYRYRIERAEEALQIPVLMANLNALRLMTTGDAHILAEQIYQRLCDAVPFIQREAGDPE